MNIKLKKEFLKTKVAFGGNAKPLGDRSDKDLEQLALIARESNNQKMINYFEELPTLDQLRKSKTDAAIAAVPLVNPADLNLVKTEVQDTKK